MRRMLVTVRWPGVRMAPISSISAWRQLRWKNSGAKQRITPAKRAGSRSMAAVLWRERPSLTAHPLRGFRPGNGQTQAQGVALKRIRPGPQEQAERVQVVARHAAGNFQIGLQRAADCRFLV